jgi:hypothetical protein
MALESGHDQAILFAHFREAEESADEDGKFSIALRATFEWSTSPTKLKVACRISKTFTDAIEASARDPAQPVLIRPAESLTRRTIRLVLFSALFTILW